MIEAWQQFYAAADVRELDRRAQETRSNLEAIKKDPRATSLRAKLSKRLDEFTRDADKIGRQVVERCWRARVHGEPAQVW